MPHYRTRKNEKKYIHYRKTEKPTGCVFCDTSALVPGQLLHESNHFRIIKNRFGYDMWDGSRVSDHIMIVPIAHTESLSTLEPAAQLEFVKLISEYETNGYDVLARSPVSSGKSVPHQHTPLIKTTGERLRGGVFLSKPYTAISW